MLFTYVTYIHGTSDSPELSDAALKLVWTQSPRHIYPI